MKKKTIILMTISFVLVALLMSFLQFVIDASDNLSRYAVYYAKNTPHKEGAEPQIVMLMEHLDRVKKPEGDLYRYHDRGGALVGLKGKNIYLITNATESYRFCNAQGIIFVITPDFKPVAAYTAKEFEPRPISSFKREDIIREIYELVQPILDVQPEPDWNLQWLFDRIYYKRFN